MLHRNGWKVRYRERTNSCSASKKRHVAAFSSLIHSIPALYESHARLPLYSHRQKIQKGYSARAVVSVWFRASTLISMRSFHCNYFHLNKKAAKLIFYAIFYTLNQVTFASCGFFIDIPNTADLKKRSQWTDYVVYQLDGHWSAWKWEQAGKKASRYNIFPFHRTVTSHISIISSRENLFRAVKNPAEFKKNFSVP